VSYLIGPVVPDGPGSSLWRRLSGLPGGVIARLRSSLPAVLHGPQKHPQAGAQKRKVLIMLNDHVAPATGREGVKGSQDARLAASRPCAHCPGTAVG
jgi:hypothetical protein